jgi:uncharacterized protein YdiU (UPF0061 family)
MDSDHLTDTQMKVELRKWFEEPLASEIVNLCNSHIGKRTDKEASIALIQDNLKALQASLLKIENTFPALSSKIFENYELLSLIEHKDFNRVCDFNKSLNHFQKSLGLAANSFRPRNKVKAYLTKQNGEVIHFSTKNSVKNFHLITELERLWIQHTDSVITTAGGHPFYKFLSICLNRKLIDHLAVRANYLRIRNESKSSTKSD